MLIITRRIGEKIRIKDDIVVQVMAINGCYARLGIEAPDDVTIHRQELYDKIKSNKIISGLKLKSPSEASTRKVDLAPSS